MQGTVRLAAVPGMAVLAGLVAAPLLLLVVQSFTGDSGFPSLHNLHHLFRTALYLRVLDRTIRFALEVTVVTLAIGWPAGWALARHVPVRRQPMILAALIIPFLTSYLLLIYGMLVLLAPGGPVASLGALVGLGGPLGAILYSPTATFLMLVNESLSFVVIILYVSAQSVRDDLIDATRSLGGGGWATFQHVIWPSAVPSLRTAFLLTFVPTAGIFAESQILGGPRDQLLGNVINDEMSLIGDLGFASTLALLLLLAIALVAAIVLAIPPLLAWGGGRARRLPLEQYPIRRTRLIGRFAFLIKNLERFPSACPDGKRSRSRRRIHLAPIALRLWLALVLLFIFAPLLAVAVLSFNRSPYGTLPFHFTLHWYGQLQDENELLRSTWSNLELSAAVAVAAALIGPPLAIFLSRGPRLLVAPFQLATLSAVTVPWLLLGIGMLLTLQSIGIDRSLFAMFLGCLAVSLPYVVFIVQARLAALDPAIEQVAQSLGASPARVLLRVTLPMIRGAVVAGSFMAFITCFNNFVVQYLLAPFGFRTLPLEIYTMVKMGYQPDINALGTLLVVAALLLVVILQLLTGSAARMMTAGAERGQDG